MKMCLIVTKIKLLCKKILMVLKIIFFIIIIFFMLYIITFYFEMKYDMRYYWQASVPPTKWIFSQFFVCLFLFFVISIILSDDFISNLRHKNTLWKYVNAKSFLPSDVTLFFMTFLVFHAFLAREILNISSEIYIDKAISMAFPWPFKIWLTCVTFPGKDIALTLIFPGFSGLWK